MKTPSRADLERAEICTQLMDNGEVRFAIQLDSGELCGQKWLEDPDYGQVRTYKVWRTRLGAVKFLKKLKLKRGIE